MDLSKLFKTYGRPQPTPIVNGSQHNTNFNLPPQQMSTSNLISPSLPHIGMEIPNSTVPVLHQPVVPDQTINSTSFQNQMSSNRSAYNTNFHFISPLTNQMVSTVQYTQDETISTSPQKSEQSEDSQFYCDSCEKGFPNEAQYNFHFKSHRPCDYEGCTYSAINSSLKAHKLSVHNPRVSKLISRLNTPEAVEAWIQARRKNFPTAEKRKEKEEEIALKGGRNRKRPNDRNDRNNQSKYKKYLTNDETKKGKTEEIKGSEVNAVMTENEEEHPEESTSKPKREPIDLSEKKKQFCKLYRAGKCRRGDKCWYSHERGGDQRRNKPNNRKKMSLLDKLASKEIITETGAILQCLDYITSSNFFEDTK